MLTVGFLKTLLGWTKTAATTGGSFVMNTLRTLGTVLLSAGGLVKKLFSNAPVFLKTQLTKAWGLARMAGASVATMAWRGLLFAAGSIGTALSASGGVIASVWSALGLGSALAAIGYVAFWALVIAAIIVTSIWVANWITNRIFKKGLWQLWEDYIESLGDWAYNQMITLGGGSMALPSQYMLPPDETRDTTTEGPG